MGIVGNIRNTLGSTTARKSGGEGAAGGAGVMRATWKGRTLAESDRTIVVEGNHYFPPESVRMDLLKPSPTHTTCPWKGKASYYSADVDGAVNEDAAWCYPDPKPAAAEIKDHIAFWRGVSVEPAPLEAGS